MIRAVVDTNVLVSGLISPRASPAKLIDLWQKRKYILVTSKEILKELRRVLNYSKIARTYHLDKKTIDEYLKGFFIFSEVCRSTKKLSVIKKDPEDNKFLETAVAGKANFIVSGDRHLLALGEYKGIKILTAKKFLDVLKSATIDKNDSD